MFMINRRKITTLWASLGGGLIMLLLLNVGVVLFLLPIQMALGERVHSDTLRKKPQLTQDSVSYPITASWFRDRFTLKEWDDTLEEFASIGGDTVWLRAPPVTIRPKEDILRDYNFRWCWDCEQNGGYGRQDCVSSAEQALDKMGLDVVALATFQYEEDFGEHLIQCPQFEEKINSSRIYYRLVLPLDRDAGKNCDLPAGTKVLVLFTSFAGTDPHHLLVESASKRNVSVYFGLPAVPMATSEGGILVNYTGAYCQFIERVLLDHRCRYVGQCPKVSSRNQVDDLNIDFQDGGRVFKMAQEPEVVTPAPLYDTIAGYYCTDEVAIGYIARTFDDATKVYTDLYSNLGTIVHNFQKKFVLSPYIDLNILSGNYSVDQHRDGLEVLADLKVVDVVAIQEGRGTAKGCYCDWDRQQYEPIAKVDPGLHEINSYLFPGLRDDVNYLELYRGSNNQLFPKLAETRDRLKQEGNHFDIWLNVEAFEYLRSDPCLPVDSAGSGMAELLQRTSKSRLDWGLSVAGGFVQKVISFAWDSDFVCTTQQHERRLVDEIKAEAGKTIMTNCSWHSPQNMSIVIIGYNLDGKFTVDYPTYQGRKQDTLSGYYFEADWGGENDREPSLLYTQLWDLYSLQYLKPHGVVHVTAERAHHPCVFTY